VRTPDHSIRQLTGLRGPGSVTCRGDQLGTEYQGPGGTSARPLTSRHDLALTCVNRHQTGSVPCRKVLCASGILLTTFLVWLITWPWIASWRAARLLRLIHAYRTALHDPAGLCPHDRDIPIGPATPAPAGRPRRL